MGRYINSVPILTAEHRVKGFVWEIRGFTRDAAGVPILPASLQYIGGTAGAAILAATQEPCMGLNRDSEKTGATTTALGGRAFSSQNTATNCVTVAPGMSSPTPSKFPPQFSAHPWKLQTHNDAAATIPFATLDKGGRYAHLESFNVMLNAPDDLPELQWCTFLCGATTGVERLCEE